MEDLTIDLPTDLDSCHSLIRELLETLRQQGLLIGHMQHQLERLLRQRYGRSSEKIDPDQLHLFAADILTEPEATKATAEDVTGNAEPPVSDDTSAADLTGAACPGGFCHLGGAAIPDSEAYGAGLVDADEAVRIASLARASGMPPWVKLEITPDPRYLLPDPVETLRAAERLVGDGFTVLPYINADPILAKRMEEVGCATVMPLGSWIGSNRGIRTREAVQIIVEQATVPVVVDAGLGAPSHAAQAMEMGVDAVLVNTAIAIAGDPIEMATAFRLGVEAGRRAFLAKPPSELAEAEPSSPLTGFLGGGS